MEGQDPRICFKYSRQKGGDILTANGAYRLREIGVTLRHGSSNKTTTRSIYAVDADGNTRGAYTWDIASEDREVAEANYAKILFKRWSFHGSPFNPNVAPGRKAAPFCDNAACPSGLQEHIEPSPYADATIRVADSVLVTVGGGDRADNELLPVNYQTFARREWEMEGQRQFFCSDCTLALLRTFNDKSRDQD